MARWAAVVFLATTVFLLAENLFLKEDSQIVEVLGGEVIHLKPTYIGQAFKSYWPKIYNAFYQTTERCYIDIVFHGEKFVMEVTPGAYIRLCVGENISLRYKTGRMTGKIYPIELYYQNERVVESCETN